MQQRQLTVCAHACERLISSVLSPSFSDCCIDPSRDHCMHQALIVIGCHSHTNPLNIVMDSVATAHIMPLREKYSQQHLTLSCQEKKSELSALVMFMLSLDLRMPTAQCKIREVFFPARASPRIEDGLPKRYT